MHFIFQILALFLAESVFWFQEFTGFGILLSFHFIWITSSNSICLLLVMVPQTSRSLTGTRGIALEPRVGAASTCLTMVVVVEIIHCLSCLCFKGTTAAARGVVRGGSSPLHFSIWSWKAAENLSQLTSLLSRSSETGRAVMTTVRGGSSCC